jgi:ubiquinone biosynthesis protein
MAVAISSLGCPPLRLSDTWRRWESTLAQLTFDLPGELHRLLGVLAQGGFEVHLRAAELEPLVARVERLGNRVAASVLTVAVIDGLADLARTDHRHRSDRHKPRLTLGLGAAGTAAAYMAWKRSAPAAALKRLRSPTS